MTRTRSQTLEERSKMKSEISGSTMDESSKMKSEISSSASVISDKKRENSNQPSITPSKKRKRTKKKTKAKTAVMKDDSDLGTHLQASMKLGALVGEEEADKGSNFVFSPLSIHAGLGLVFGLLDKKEKLSMLSFLDYRNLKDLSIASEKLVDAVRPSKDESVLKISLANGVWADESLVLNPSFKKTAESIYKALIKRVNLTTQYQETRIEISQWIEKETSGFIKNFMPEIDHKINYIVANALFFKGKWEHAFHKFYNKDKDFHLLDGRTHVKVPFMAMHYDIRFFSSYKDFKALVLPYKQDNEGRDLSMIFFLPHERDGIKYLAKKLASDPTFLSKHVPQTTTRVDTIRIPKFKISSKFDATEYLKKLGLDTDADLAKTYHAATIEVDEEGTTASAVLWRGGAMAARAPNAEFIADHPFIFAIRENESGAILFFGYVVNPSLSE